MSLAGEIAGHLNACGVCDQLQFERAIRWPYQKDKRLWPRADISGYLTDGSLLIVELDDMSDPVPNIIKYWPLLDGILNGEDHPPICLVSVTAPCETYGRGCHERARFVGRKLQAMYTPWFRFGLVRLNRRDMLSVSKDIIAAILCSPTKE